MRKELIPYEHGGKKELRFKAAVKSTVAPVIASTYTENGIRYYKDTAGKTHAADVYDQVFGIRDPSAIRPALKARFIRAQPFKKIRK